MAVDDMKQTIALALAASLFAGCLLSSDSPSYPRVGMGLEIPAVLPAPGPFLEPAEELTALERFVRDEGPSILHECKGDAMHMEGVERRLDQGRHWRSLTDLVWACGTDQHRELALMAIREGNETMLREALLSEALAAIEDLRVAINAHPGPGSVVEAQIMVWVMYRYVTSHATLTAGAEFLWELYLESPGDDYLLGNLILNIIGPFERAGPVKMILDRYPWGSPPCVAPDVDAVSEQIEAAIHSAHELAARYGHDELEDPRQRNSHYRMLVVNLIPYFETARREAWWPSMLDFGGDIQTRLAYWESFSAPAWPTADEAAYLLAQYRNETRTIWTERILMPYVTYFAGRVDPDWESDLEFGPPGFLGTMALEWPFADLECPANP